MPRIIGQTIIRTGLALWMLATAANGQTSAVAEGQDSALSRGNFYHLLTADENWNAVSLGAAVSGADCAIFARPESGYTFREEELTDMERNERVAFLTWGGTLPDPEISIVVGAPVAHGSNDSHVLVVDDQLGFPLIGDGERLMVHPSHDERVIAAVRRGAKMLVQGQLEDGNVVRDTYSLQGVIAATDTLHDRCG